MKPKFALLAVIALSAAMSSAARAQTGGELSRFDTGYLDEHPEVARQLGQNPNLANDPNYLATHPGLDQYLASHPGVRTELQTHPGNFMSDARQYKLSSGFAHGYLDDHPEVARQLAKDPSLADNPQFLSTHPGLDDYLATHRNVRAELQSHPGYFMNDEWRWHLAPGERRNQSGITRGEVSRFDESYLDQHRDVERSLKQNPGLANDPHFLATHPGLDSYLASHRGVRTQLQAHPGNFMGDERRRERRERRHQAGS